MTARRQIAACVGLGIALLASPWPNSSARAGDDSYSIMAPEPGIVSRHRAKSATHPQQAKKTSRGRVKLLAKTHNKTHKRSNAMAVRGSSGSVLPTPLPRTEQIPPITTRIPPAIAVPNDPGLTIVPGLRPTPNLPHGTESFQDRAARCAHQAGIYGVPNDQRNAYMGACAM